jgi:hypothetical protein
VRRLPVSSVFALRDAQLTPLRHDSHPVAVGAYYDDQKTEAHRRSIDFRKSRLPKFLSSVRSAPLFWTGALDG